MILRLCLDLNVFFSHEYSQAKRIYPSAAGELVGWVESGICPAGPVQLLISWPMIEQWENVLIRHFGMTKIDAEALAGSLAILASDGPALEAPHVVLGSGYVPFATEQEMLSAVMTLKRKSAQSPDQAPLYDAVEDDRIVFLTALAAKADVLVTDNIQDFRRGSYVDFERSDLILITHGSLELVVARPFFVAHWLRAGLLPDAKFVRAHPNDFAIKAAEPISTPGLR